MRRRRFWFVSVFLGQCLCLLSAGRAADAAADTSAFEGAWIGTIAGPDRSTEFGVAFTTTEKGQLVSVYLPEMFVYNVNFGPANIRAGTFHLDPLHLELHRDGDALTGAFGIPHLPVVLHAGTSFAPTPPEPAYPAAPAPAWTHSLGSAAWASPVARDGVVYVGTVDGSFHAVRAADGRELWTWRGTHALYGTALATDDAVYFIDDATDLIRLDRSDGALVWRVPLHEESSGSRTGVSDETFTHRAATPIIDARGILYAGSTDGAIYALRARNGRILWRHPAGAPIHAALTLDGGTLIAGCFDGTVLALDSRRRKELFRVKLGGPIVSAPVVAGDTLVVGSRDYLLYGLRRSDGAVKWRDAYWFSWVESAPRVIDATLYIGGSDFRRISALDPADGRRRWATDVLGLTWGTPVIEGDIAYAAAAGQHLEGTVIHHQGGIVALDRRTGAVAWRYAAPVPPGAEMSGFAGSLVLAGRHVIGAALDGTLIAFQTTAETDPAAAAK